MRREELEEIITFKKADDLIVRQIQGGFTKNNVSNEYLFMNVNPFDWCYDWCDIVDALDNEHIPIHLVANNMNEPIMVVYAVDKEKIYEAAQKYIEWLREE